ncbi:hypothetical protein [Virgibacillus kimchii]
MSVWTMRDGTKVAIKDMSTSHIVNSMKMLERNVMHIKMQYGSRALSFVNGDMATMAAEDYVTEMYEMPDIEFLREHTDYKSLEIELEMRSEY